MYAIRSYYANGVSELHGQVSREMWAGFFNVSDPSQVPIGHITNGVHILGWMANRTRQFWHKHLGAKWIYYLKKQAIWTQVSDPELIPDEDLWALRYGLRRDLVITSYSIHYTKLYDCFFR